MVAMVEGVVAGHKGNNVEDKLDINGWMNKDVGWSKEYGSAYKDFGGPPCASL